LTRKKKDHASLRPIARDVSGYPRQVPQRLLRSKACIYSRHCISSDLVSVLDLDNAAVGFQSRRTVNHCTPTRVQPTTLIISLNDVKRSRRTAASDWTGQPGLSDQVGWYGHV